MRHIESPDFDALGSTRFFNVYRQAGAMTVNDLVPSAEQSSEAVQKLHELTVHEPLGVTIPEWQAMMKPAQDVLQGDAAIDNLKSLVSGYFSAAVTVTPQASVSLTRLMPSRALVTTREPYDGTGEVMGRLCDFNLTEGTVSIIPIPFSRGLRYAGKILVPVVDQTTGNPLIRIEGRELSRRERVAGPITSVMAYGL